MPVLTLDVNEEHLKRLEAIFEKYRNGLMIGPAGTPLKIPSNTGQGGGARQTTTGGEANQAPRNRLHLRQFRLRPVMDVYGMKKGALSVAEKHLIRW
ncbi:hypothetical protein O5175_04595 [Escherichia coli]|nr:hypothetical protein [Escherichia coli]